MKRTSLLLAGVAVALALVLSLPALADEDDYGPGWGGPGYGHHMGPGMMGGWGPGYGPGMMGPGMMGGYGPGMMGPGMMGGFGPGMMRGWGPGMMGLLQERLPADKLEQLRQLQFSHMQAMTEQFPKVQSARIALAQVMSSYPVDSAAAKERFAALNEARAALFDLRVQHMTQVQQLIGEELWNELHNGFGPGYGRGHGPGMMGPGGPRR